MTKSLIVLSGPTGSGKTRFAEELAEKFSLELFNADAFQFYREIPVIGNQPSPLGRWKFIAFQSLKQPLNAGDFSRLADPHLHEGGLWVGTGLYLGAALYGLDEERIKGVPFQRPPKRQFKAVVFDPERSQLYANLNSRVEQMMARGALEEARALHSLIREGQIERSNVVLKAIGLKQLLNVCDQQQSLTSAIEEWKRDTRRLAKRQWTWLRKFMPPTTDCLWVDPKGPVAQAEDFVRRSLNN